MRSIVEAFTGANAKGNEEHTRKIAAVTSIEDAKAVVGDLINKCKCGRDQKAKLKQDLDKCSTVSKCQRIGYDLLLDNKQMSEAKQPKSLYTDKDHAMLAAAKTIFAAKAAVNHLIDKAASSKEKKEQMRASLEKIGNNWAKVVKYGYDIILKGENRGVIKEGAELGDHVALTKIDQLSADMSVEDIQSALIDIANETPEMTVADIRDLLDQIDGMSAEQSIAIARDLFADALECHVCDHDDQYEDNQDEQGFEGQEDDLDTNLDQDQDQDQVVDDIDAMTGEELDDEEFEELDLPENIQEALLSIEDEEVREIIEDMVIEFLESGMDQGEIEDQIEDFNHLTTGVLSHCEQECEPEKMELVQNGIEAVKQAMFGDQSDEDDLDGEDQLGQEVDLDVVDDQIDDQVDDIEPQPRKFGDLVGAKRIGANEM
jgi:hypothetical protein